MSDNNEHKLLLKCLQLIEDKLDWGPAAQWHSDVFIELSEAIQKETQVLLSPVTLKRVWGKVNYKSAPSISTLNTLSQFAGYSNWRDFKNSQHLKKASWFETNISPNLGVIMFSAAIMTIVFISLYSLTGSENSTNEIDVSKIQFSSKPIVDGLPNSVVFDFDLNSTQSDSIYIQQFWDPTKIIKLTQDQVQATGQYYYPGYFRAKLIVDGIILKEHDLFIKSNGWIGTLDYDPIPKYINDKRLNSGKLSFSNSISEEIKTSDKPLLASFHYINDIPKISGDDFTLQSSIKSIYHDKWAVCQKTSIVVVGTKSAFIIPFSIPGCTSELNGMVSEKALKGKNMDLSSLGIDFSSERRVLITSKDKVLKVYIDDLEVFSKDYAESIGNIVGIRYRFLGISEIRDIKLLDEFKRERSIK
ncbi:hypothetical protein [uncultured Psychroserpens sp.]|uniref:hypothetical protein n=1 Tax=uncultured Psychroserpens sp. TaxID=255436 RepID=UPI00263A35E0|nr:hypothetical protein [uncultured Psychroserpens sp.]